MGTSPKDSGARAPRSSAAFGPSYIEAVAEASTAALGPALGRAAIEGDVPVSAPLADLMAYAVGVGEKVGRRSAEEGYRCDPNPPPASLPVVDWDRIRDRLPSGWYVAGACSRCEIPTHLSDGEAAVYFDGSRQLVVCQHPPDMDGASVGVLELPPDLIVLLVEVWPPQ